MDKDEGRIYYTELVDHVIDTLVEENNKGSNNEADTATTGNNNNASNSSVDNSDMIKASIYNSLKKDLLKKNLPGAKPGDTPARSLLPNLLHPNYVRSKKDSVTKPKEAPRVPSTEHQRSPAAEVSRLASSEAGRIPSVEVLRVPASDSVRVSALEPSQSREFMRLVSQSLTTPVSLGQSSVTITRAPRSQGSVLPPSFKEQSSSSSVSLTSTSISEKHSSSLIVTGPTRGILLGHQLTNRAHSQPLTLAHQSVTLSHQPLVQHSPHKTEGMTHQQATMTQIQGLVSQPLSFSRVGPIPGAVHISTTSSMVISSIPSVSNHQGQPVQLLMTSTRPSSDCGAVNLTVSKMDEREEEDGRKSARSCKGKRYQEFIEDGRIVVGQRKRRSHKSGEESEEEAALNLSQDLGNHWKKKQVRTSNGSNGHGDGMNGKFARTEGSSSEEASSNAFPPRYLFYENVEFFFMNFMIKCILFTFFEILLIFS